MERMRFKYNPDVILGHPVFVDAQIKYQEMLTKVGGLPREMAENSTRSIVSQIETAKREGEARRVANAFVRTVRTVVPPTQNKT